MIQILRNAAGRVYESAVVWTLIFSVVRTFGNLLVLPVMLRKLPAEDLGFWYVFLALAGISSLVDMGFFPTMSRVTAYLWAGAKEIPRMGVVAVEEEPGADLAPNYRLLADLVKTMRLYYLGLGALVTILMAAGGTAWVVAHARSLPHANLIVGAWLLFLPALFVNTTSGMWHPLLSGINRVRLGQQISVWASLVNYSVTLAALLLGAGLYAPVAGYLMMGLVSRMAARFKFNELTAAKAHAKTARWSRDLLGALWPTAWRTGIVTLGIYLTLNASTLICASYLGVKTTASFGLSMQLTLAAISIATAFVSVKLPLFAQLHARNRRYEIAQIVFSRLRWFWLVYLGLSLVTIFFANAVLVNFLHSKTPLLSTSFLVVLFFIVGLEGHHAIFREITLTSHRNPFALPVVLSGIFIVFLSILLVPWIGVWGLLLAPGVVQLSFNNWWTVLVGLRSMGATAIDYPTGLFGWNSRRRANH